MVTSRQLTWFIRPINFAESLDFVWITLCKTKLTLLKVLLLVLFPNILLLIFGNQLYKMIHPTLFSFVRIFLFFWGADYLILKLKTFLDPLTVPSLPRQYLFESLALFFRFLFPFLFLYMTFFLGSMVMLSITLSTILITSSDMITFYLFCFITGVFLYVIVKLFLNASILPVMTLYESDKSLFQLYSRSSHLFAATVSYRYRDTIVVIIFALIVRALFSVNFIMLASIETVTSVMSICTILVIFLSIVFCLPVVYLNGIIRFDGFDIQRRLMLLKDRKR